jgi:hypothetical protein
MNTNRDLPIGVLIFIISLFPLAYAYKLMNLSILDSLIVLGCYIVYDWVSWFGFSKMFGWSKDDKAE